MEQKIKKDSFAIIQRVIRRYPDTKVEYEEERQQICANGIQPDGLPKGNLAGNPVESMAIKLNSPKMLRMLREIEAIESTYEELNDHHKKIIKTRFWSSRDRNMPYLWMEQCTGYSERQMKRVCVKFIKSVGRKIGEI